MMNSGSLFFGTSMPLPISRDKFLEQLQSIGLIGKPYEVKENRYLTGDRFLQLITFLGCSPYLQLNPPEDGSDGFCHVFIPKPLDNPKLIFGSNTNPPRCAHCKLPQNNWRTTIVDAPYGKNTKARCLRCNNPYEPTQLSWRRDAGYVRFFIRIFEVFPGEAVPSTEFMTALQKTGVSWHFFYVQNPEVH
ncbi:MAG: hypothetical protein GY703_10930 [Gammaproteobacteria bacterium]|nr:hypothetical protein [Gammaproteobacteria bacterium]